MFEVNDKTRLIAALPHHAEVWHSWRNQAAAKHFMPMMPISIDQVRSRLEHCDHDLQIPDRPEYRWIIEYQHEPVGTVAVTKLSTLHRHAEISYHLDENFHRRGIGTAAVGKLVERLYSETALHRLYATISCGNLASRRLVESLGFQQEACLRDHFVIEGNYVDQLIFGLLKSEWQNIRTRK